MLPQGNTRRPGRPRMKRPYTKRPVLDRLLEKITKNPDTGCWEWQASLDKNGYGQFSINGGVKRSHAIAYELLKGPIPDGHEPDHTCRNRRCINPDHLEPVTHRINIHRGNSPMGINARKTHCTRGHPLSEENTWINKRGNRSCKQCSAANLKRWYQDNREHNRQYQRDRSAAKKKENSV